MMYDLIDYHIPEAIQIQVTKRTCLTDIANDEIPELNIEPNLDDNSTIRRFCVDPQITSFSILQTLVVRAFELECDFSLFYFDRSTKSRHFIAGDQQLRQAFHNSSDPHLEILLYVVDYNCLPTWNQELATDLQQQPSSGSKMNSSDSIGNSLSRYQNVLAEWDVVTSSDIILAQTITKTNNFILQQIEKIKNKAKSFSNSTSNNSWYLAETIFQYIIASSDDKQVDPLDDMTFRNFLDSDGRIKSQRDLRITIYRRGVDSSLRRVIWKHLLNVYPDGYTGQQRMDYIKAHAESYRKMRDLWQENTKIDDDVIKLCHMVRKDVLRTDRQHPFYASCNEMTAADFSADAAEFDNLNLTSLNNILVTYALNHKYHYCQGMSDLASPLLFVMKDEAHAYISFCALMKRLGANFSSDGEAISRKFGNLTSLIQHYDPEFYDHLKVTGSEELLFCYRWMLLDLKREFCFDDTLDMLEVLWASIPPTADSSSKLSLFDENYLYSPNTKAEQLQRRKQEQQLQAAKSNELGKSLEKPKLLNSPKLCNKNNNKPVNNRIRSIKFLPNVLSTDSQELDSPTSSDSDCETNSSAGTPSNNGRRKLNLKPWDSPDMTIQRRVFDFHLPSFHSNRPYLGATLSGDYNCSYDTDNGDDSINGGGGGDGGTYFAINRSTNETNRPIVDDNFSCSTFDSGIQSSHNLSAMLNASIDSVHSINETENVKPPASSLATKRRHVFHCLNGLRNAHCNGDMSDDDDEDDNESENESDNRFVDFDSCSFRSTSSIATKSDSNSIKLLNSDDKSSELKLTKQNFSKPLYPLFKSRNLLTVGKSLSIDSLTNCSFETMKEKINDSRSSQLNTIGSSLKADHSSIHSEFISDNLNAKSVSEEMLNQHQIVVDNTDQQVKTLTVNDSNLDNVYSTSTSSLVILSTASEQNDCVKATATTTTTPTKRLLSPDELGPTDAFSLFLCLTILLQNRDKILEENMDGNDIQMYFDNMIRKHNVRSVLNDARHLFHTYLSQWHKECLHQ